VNDPAVFKHTDKSSHGEEEHSSSSEHILPLFERIYPLLHTHANDPFVFWHVELASGHVFTVVLHSLMSIHCVPLAWDRYPWRHVHVNDPFVSVHVASAAQLCVPNVHSFTSVCVCMYVCIYSGMYMYMCVCVCMYIRMYKLFMRLYDFDT
jgi:hypothetical protein